MSGFARPEQQGGIDAGDIVMLAPRHFLRMQAPGAAVTVRKVNGGDQFMGVQTGAMEAEVEIGQWQAAFALRAGQRQFGTEGEQDHGHVGNRRGIDQVAAEGGAGPHGGRREKAQEMRQVRPVGGNRRVTLEFLDGDGGAQAQAIGSRFDAAQAGQVVQLQQALAADAVRVLHRPVGIAGDHRLLLGEMQQFAIGHAQGMPGLGDGRRQQAEVGRLVEAERPARQMVADGRHRPANAAVAGAATEVAAGGIGQGLAVEQGAGQRDDQAGGAITALHATLVDQRLLHRGQLVAIEAFGGDDVAVGNLAGGQQAGAQGAVMRCRVAGFDFADQHQAGAAVATAAGWLGGSQPPILAQKVEQAGIGRCRQVHPATVEHQAGHATSVRVKARPSNKPRSLSLSSGMTSRAMKESVMYGARSGEPRRWRTPSLRAA